MPNYTPPNPPPNNPNNPPPIYVPYPVNNGGGTAADFNLDNNSNSDSQSRSNSNNEVSNAQTNVQINNTQNTFDFGVGIKAPVTTINLSAYSSVHGDHGLVATVSIPIGGSTGKRHAKLQQAIADRNALEGQIALANACANIAKSGVIIDYSLEEFASLRACQGVKIASAAPVQQQQVIIQEQKVYNPPVSPPPPSPPENGTPIRGLW